MKFATALRSELLKTKRTASPYVALAGAAFIPIILLLNVLLGGSDLAAIRKDPLNSLFEMGAERNGVLFLPIFVILVCTLLPQIEYRNHTWKQVLTAPQTKGSVFLVKFININLQIILFMVASLVYMTIAVVLIHYFKPTLNLLQHSFDVSRFVKPMGNTYITILAMCSFQYWLALRFRNFVVPTAIGFVFWISGLVMVLEYKSSFMLYFPHSLQVFPFASKFQSQMTQVVWTSSAYAVLFLILGFLDFRRRRITA